MLAAYLKNNDLSVGDGWGDSVGKGERDIADIAKTSSFKSWNRSFRGFFFFSFPAPLRWAILMKKILLTLQKGDVRGFDCH